MAGTRLLTHGLFVLGVLVLLPFLLYINHVPRAALPHTRIQSSEIRPLLDSLSAKPSWRIIVDCNNLAQILQPEYPQVELWNPGALDGVRSSDQVDDAEDALLGLLVANECYGTGGSGLRASNFSYFLTVTSFESPSSSHPAMVRQRPPPTFCTVHAFPDVLDANDALLCYTLQQLMVSSYGHAFLRIPTEPGHPDLSPPLVMSAVHSTLANLRQRLSIPTNPIASSSYRLTFSLINQEPGKGVCRWQFPRFRTFIDKSLEGLKGALDFSIRSQNIIYASMAALDPTPVFSSSKGVGLGKGAIVALTAPTTMPQQLLVDRRTKALEFVYICNDHKGGSFPIYFSGDNISHTSEACHVRGWGGVTIINMDVHESGGERWEYMLSDHDYASMGSAFAEQLRGLLGLPEIQSEKGVVKMWGGRSLAYEYQGVRGKLLSPFEEDVLLLRTCCGWLERSLELLDAIVVLVGNRPYMSVQPEVVELLETSLDELEEVTRLLNSMQGLEEHWKEAMDLANRALAGLESAYYHPTLMNPLYFPFQHVLAIYMPLIAPLFLPLFYGLYKESLRFRDKQAKKNRGGVTESPSVPINDGTNT